jgi:hypothetical protein
MHNSLKIIKTLLYSYSALHVPGTLAPIIRSLLILHIQPPVTVCRWVGCVFHLWSVLADARNHGPLYIVCISWNINLLKPTGHVMHKPV